MQRATVTAAVIAAAAVAACADPYASEAPSGRATAVAGEIPAPPVRQAAEPLIALPASPEAAARRAAELTTTWSSENAARRYAELATIATGPARREAQQTAARLPTDPQLDGTRSEGHVAAVVTRSARNGEHEMLVITRETVRADGLVDRRWRVTLASVERRDGGWAVSRWEPQP